MFLIQNYYSEWKFQNGNSYKFPLVGNPRGPPDLILLQTVHDNITQRTLHTEMFVVWDREGNVGLVENWWRTYFANGHLENSAFDSLA